MLFWLKPNSFILFQIPDLKVGARKFFSREKKINIIYGSGNIFVSMVRVENYAKRSEA
jgi:hypothetical protein